MEGKASEERNPSAIPACSTGLKALTYIREFMLHSLALIICRL